ncbi:hypothetical protein [Actinoplanes aureus]|uniref:Uncharacterized protein n=1 Tax=Actinoplanes aureus TaxID=2792083 RepID=A0A931CI65_9ACTN|nr:hypothetical protein [Actinoplanes aureus]MBG0565375.1 hypothetical protein [Actinoplanes aureus]
MIASQSLYKVLADTRSADQVIRLTAEAVPTGAGGPITTNDIYRHEWTHYLQFSSLPTGVFLSQYRRNCFTNLKSLLRDSVDVGGLMADSYFEQFATLKASWEAWPADWYAAYAKADTRIAHVHLDRTGTLHVELEGIDYTVSLGLGLHAIYEAMAWCAAEMTHNFKREVPQTVDSLVYTWPLWVLAEATGRGIGDLRDEELMSLMPFLLLAACYDHRILPKAKRLPKSFASMTADLAQRDVTAGRLAWQLFNDYERFWSRAMTAANCDTYLSEIGLPILPRLFGETMDVIRLSLTEHQQFMSTLNDTALADFTPLLPDLLAEIDLLESSLSNMGTMLTNADRALLSPLMLEQQITQPVCALETPQGYDWFTILYEGDGPTEKQRSESRVVLRQMAAIMEHMLTQLAFDKHIACYGQLDWRRPINSCPVAERCMAIPRKRGIEFCTDQAWRERVGEVIPSVFNHHGVEPPEELIPGISAAIVEHQTAARGEGPPLERVSVDLKALGLQRYLSET